MSKALEFRKNADECRMLARQMKPGRHRDQLVQMAEAWERLAAQQEAGAPVQLDAAPAKPQKK